MKEWAKERRRKMTKKEERRRGEEEEEKEERKQHGEDRTDADQKEKQEDTDIKTLSLIHI